MKQQHFNSPTQRAIAPSPGPTPIIITGPPGPPGPQGTRGSLWYTGTTDPGGITGTDPIAGVPSTGVQVKDMYLNTTNGDVWQFT